MSKVISQVDKNNIIDLRVYNAAIKIIDNVIQWSVAQAAEVQSPEEYLKITWDDYAHKSNELAELLEQAGIKIELLREVVRAAQKVEEQRTKSLILRSLWGNEIDWIFGWNEEG